MTQLAHIELQQQTSKLAMREYVDMAIRIAVNLGKNALTLEDRQHMETVKESLTMAIDTINNNIRNKPEPKTPFEAGYKAYIDTAMRLVQHELERIDYHDAMINVISPEVERLSAIKCGLQIAIDGMNNDYSKETKAIEQLATITNEMRAIRLSFGGKAD